MSEFNWKTTILPLVVGLVVMVIGYVTINLAYGIGTFAIQQLNGSMTVPMQPLIPDNALTIVGIIFMIIGFSIAGPALALLIKSLLSALTTSA